LVGPEPTTERFFARLLDRAGYGPSQAVAKLSITQLAHAAPSFLLIDFQNLDIDELETLRQVRFVLPNCIIAVYSENSLQSWALECHLAGANCVIAKKSDKVSVAAGIRQASLGGCYTDANFRASKRNHDSL
jgi:DNA-binding NarL/FixJ family response regulator